MNQYKLAPLTPPAVKGDGILEEWVQVYNNSGGDLANGLVKMVGFLVDTGTTFSDATTASPIIVAVPNAAATKDTESNIVGVIDNPPELVASTTPISQYSGIKSTSLGWLKTKGVVQALVDGTNDIALGDQLEVLTTATSLIVAASASSGASGTLEEEAVAIALEVYTSSTPANKWVHLIGRPVAIKGS